jgi:hypothetical protein
MFPKKHSHIQSGTLVTIMFLVLLYIRVIIVIGKIKQFRGIIKRCLKCGELCIKRGFQIYINAG